MLVLITVRLDDGGCFVSDSVLLPSVTRLMEWLPRFVNNDLVKTNCTMVPPVGGSTIGYPVHV